MVSEMERYKNVIQNQDIDISNLNKEKLILLNKNEELTKEVRSAYSSGKAKDEKLSLKSNQISEANKLIEKLKIDINRLEKENDKLNIENQNLSSNNKIEVKNNFDNRKTIEFLEAQLSDKTNQLNRCAYDLDNAYSKVDKLKFDYNKIYTEIEKLKDHIQILTEQNQRVKIF